VCLPPPSAPKERQSKQTRGVCGALPFKLKRYLKAKEEEE